MLGKVYFIIMNTKTMENFFFYHTDFIIITFYRLKAKRGTSSGEGKGHLLGNIPLLHTDTLT